MLSFHISPVFAQGRTRQVLRCHPVDRAAPQQHQCAPPPPRAPKLPLCRACARPGASTVHEQRERQTAPDRPARAQEAAPLRAPDLPHKLNRGAPAHPDAADAKAGLGADPRPQHRVARALAGPAAGSPQGARCENGGGRRPAHASTYAATAASPRPPRSRAGPWPRP